MIGQTNQRRKLLLGVAALVALPATLRTTSLSGQTVSAEELGQVSAKLHTMIPLMNAAWRDLLARRGASYIQPVITAYTGPTWTIACDSIPPSNAVHCPSHLYTTIFYDSVFVTQRMKLAAQALGTDGDAIPITIIAHEMGHAVQRMLGVLHKSIMSGFEEEQSADCLAGVLLAELGGKGMLEPGDLEEAAWTLATLDDRALRGPRTVIKDQIFHMDPGAHGSAQERRSALMRGYQSGISVCLGR